MSFIDRLFGRPEDQRPPSRTPSRPLDQDQMAVERYRYLLRTAPPEDLERAHAEAFAQLTPEQRAMVRDELVRAVPDEAPRSDAPNDLARSATRAELRRPGTMERTFQRQGAMPGMAGTFFSTLAGAFVGTAIAQSLFGAYGDPFAGDAGAAEGDASGETGDATGADAGGDAWGDGSADAGGWDQGGDFGGGDF
jgi:hypothetical protein